MEIAVFIQNIQEERAEVALYIFSNQTSAQINETVHQTGNKKSLEDRFQQTDRALEEVPTWPDVMQCTDHLMIHFCQNCIKMCVLLPWSWQELRKQQFLNQNWSSRSSMKFLGEYNHSEFNNLSFRHILCRVH